MADLYIVTTECVDDGIWFDDPEGFDTEADARAEAAKRRKPPQGHCYGIYACRLLDTAQENIVE